MHYFALLRSFAFFLLYNSQVIIIIELQQLSCRASYGAFMFKNSTRNLLCNSARLLLCWARYEIFSLTDDFWLVDFLMNHDRHIEDLVALFYFFAHVVDFASDRVPFR